MPAAADCLAGPLRAPTWSNWISMLGNTADRPSRSPWCTAGLVAKQMSWYCGSGPATFFSPCASANFSTAAGGWRGGRRRAGEQVGSMGRGQQALEKSTLDNLPPCDCRLPCGQRPGQGSPAARPAAAVRAPLAKAWKTGVGR